MRRTEDWLNQARAELRAARDLLNGEHWSWCCFTCQQVAEKALKASCEHFRVPQFGHNLNLLVQVLDAQTTVSDPVRRACARLNRYYIPTRYPDAFPEGAPAAQFFAADASQALDDARTVVEFVEAIVEGG